MKKTRVSPWKTLLCCAVLGSSLIWTPLALASPPVDRAEMLRGHVILTNTLEGDLVAALDVDPVEGEEETFEQVFILQQHEPAAYLFEDLRDVNVLIRRGSVVIGSNEIGKVFVLRLASDDREGVRPRASEDLAASLVSMRRIEEGRMEMTAVEGYGLARHRSRFSLDDAWNGSLLDRSRLFARRDHDAALRARTDAVFEKDPNPGGGSGSCNSGGIGSTRCQQSCSDGTSCEVDCSKPQYACCNCAEGGPASCACKSL